MRKISSLWTSLRNRLILTFVAIFLITVFFSGLSLYQNLAVELPQIGQEELSAQTRELRFLLEQELTKGQTLDVATQAIVAIEPPDLRLHIYSVDGRQITDFSLRPGERTALETVWLGQEEEKILIDESGRRYVLTALPIRNQERVIGAMVAVSSLSVVDRLLAIIFPRLYVALIFTLIAIVGAGMYIAGNVSRVLREVEDVAREIIDGRFDRRIKVSSQDEIGRLATTINHMAEELQSLSQARGQFLSKVSHELRTPLTIIKGFANTALRDELPLEQERRLKIIDEQTDKLTRLVDDLLSLARKDAGKLELQRTEVDLVELLREVEASNRYRAERRGIHLFLTTQLNEVIACIDRDRIGEVLQNLLDNAFKFTPEGGSVELKFQAVADKLDITVADSGRGISEESLPFVFERFYTLDPRQQGTGLGLAIARELVQLHGGEISVESQHGVGTQFKIRLPRNMELPARAENRREGYELARAIE